MIRDTLDRPLRNLRLSVTDRCNLRCTYCMPEKEYVWLPRGDLLSFEEITANESPVLAPARNNRGQKSVLIIDDELSTSWALAEGLSDDGFTIDTFRSAEEAAERVGDPAVAHAIRAAARRPP